MNRDTGKLFIDLMEIVARLRSADGCPWDKKQTAASFKSYLIEETHELAEAIEAGEPGHVREELGDLLFQIVFLCRLYEEREEFNAADAMETICQKMIRRHPHVFGDATVASLEEQRRLWMAIKADEQEGKKNAGPHFLNAVPGTLPALRRAQRVSERAAQAGFDWPDLPMIFDKLDEEVLELKQAIAAGNQAQIFDELGDLLFTGVNLGRRLNANAEDALHSATAKFIGRFINMENVIAEGGQKLSEADSDTLMRRWEQAKNR
jgi:MazG family protein